MAKSKEEAKAEGFKRGLEGRSSAAGITQGWSDDKVSGPARNEGFVEGKRKRSRAQAEAAKTARDKK
jgi:hypothetical protein